MRIKENHKIREVAGEKLVILQAGIPIDFTQVMVFNSTSEWLWNQLIGSDFEIEKVVSLLHSKFNLDESTANKDAKKWLDQLSKFAILE